MYMPPSDMGSSYLAYNLTAFSTALMKSGSPAILRAISLSSLLLIINPHLGFTWLTFHLFDHHLTFLVVALIVDAFQ